MHSKTATALVAGASLLATGTAFAQDAQPGEAAQGIREIIVSANRAEARAKTAPGTHRQHEGHGTLADFNCAGRPA